MKKIKALLLRVKAWIIDKWEKSEDYAEKFAPIAINILEEIKKVNESTVGDVIELITTKAIKGEADDYAIRAARLKLKEYLPKWIETTRLALQIAQVEDKAEQVKMVLDAVNKLDGMEKWSKWHDLAVKTIYITADGKLTWSECVLWAELYFKTTHPDE